MNKSHTETIATSAGNSPTHRKIARVITEVLSPINTLPVLLTLVALDSTQDLVAALRWALVAALFASALPATYLAYRLKRRTITDYHVRVREQRPRLALFLVPSVITGAVILTLTGAPQTMVALAGALVVGLLAALLITFFWKMSVHVAVSSGTVMILMLVFGPWMILLTPMVGLSAWSRVILRDHTIAQVVGGAIVGSTVAGVVFTLLR